MNVEPASAFTAADDRVHVHDPEVWSWNESFLLSWLSHDEGPAGLFRLGLLPNQGRGWLWFFLFHDGEWLALEETRLDFRHFDLADGASYDAWGLRFGWTSIEPLRRGRFHLEGIALVRRGPRAGTLVPLAIDLTASATSPCFGTGTGHEPEEQPQFPASRFEQSVMFAGSLTVGDSTRPINCSGHRDRSWGHARGAAPTPWVTSRARTSNSTSQVRRNPANEVVGTSVTRAECDHSRVSPDPFTTTT